MDSPLARVILATIGGYLIILLFLSVYDWFVEEFPRRPTEPTNSARIQHQLHHQEAIKALKLFSRLPKHEKAAIKDSLESNLISMKQWLTYLRKSNFQILCMGELHEESTRSFLSKEFFFKLHCRCSPTRSYSQGIKTFNQSNGDGQGLFSTIGC
ncbi:MAG: hypothetical protein KJO26_14565 [Deltaproteobacteria bacterium]|nr:hypothetical protein [Deltaproteobacteria bacterium]